jgi:Zn-dependent oligopeptidase
VHLIATRSLRAGAALQPWDQDFYTRQLALSLPHHADVAAAAAPYLHLGSVLGGLSELLQRLMGLRLQRRQLAPGEGWGAGESGRAFEGACWLEQKASA